MDIATVELAAAAEGLVPRGAFHPRSGDLVPDLTDGSRPATLVLLGNVGGSLWRAFSAAQEVSDRAPDPLDRWSQRVIGGLARSLGAEPLYPFGGPPYLPFVDWAKRAEPVAESPLGMLIHPDHGLWHAYRGALVFKERIALPAALARPRPCDDCPDMPCLRACPVGAFGTAGYDVAACTSHISHPAGQDCLDLGCRARRACPVGQGDRYGPAQARFHMAAFRTARRTGAAA